MYSSGQLEIGKELWYKIVYDIFYAFDTTNMGPSLIEALKSLYFGRFVSFYRETIDKSYTESEEEIMAQAKLFFDRRNYLLKKYN